MLSIIIFERNLKRVYRLYCKPWLKLTVAPVAVVFIDFLKVLYFFSWLVILKDGDLETSSLAQSLLGSVSCLAARPHALKLASLTLKNL